MGVSNLQYRFLVISGPSGVGKSQVISYMRSNSICGIEWEIIKRITTRPQRPFDSYDEISFVTEDEFTRHENNGDLLYSEVYSGTSSKYGVLIIDLLTHVQESTPNTVLIVTGTLALCRILPKCAFVYLVPPSLDELQSRILRSHKPNATRIFSYDILEINEIASLSSSTYSYSNLVSIIANKTNRVDECANKIGNFILENRQITELPHKLMSQLKIATKS